MRSGDGGGEAVSDVRAVIQGVLDSHDAQMTDGLLTDIVEAVEAWADQ